MIASTGTGSSVQTTSAAKTGAASAAAALGVTAVTGLAAAVTGLTGAGVKIGIISDSFDALGTASADEADGALPSAVQVLTDTASGHDEGRAMAEVAHGVASGAEVAFSAAGGSVANMAASIAALQAAGCKVICDDVTYANEPFFQMGDAVEQAISAFTAAGGVYFTAASNAGPNSAYETAFSGVAAMLPGIGAVTAMNFGTAAAPQTTDTLSLAAGHLTSLDLQWAQPWASIDGAGSAYSLAFAVYDPTGKLVKTFASDQVGGDAVQSGCFTPAVTGTYTVAIWVNGGTDTGGTFKIVANNNASATAVFGKANGGSVVGHNMDPQAITVGAVSAANTPSANGTLKSEAFSAGGISEALFSDTGVPLATPRTLHAVTVSGPDGIATTLPGSDLNPFYGTSCATPAVAAVGALMKQADPSLDAGEIKAFLKGSALAFGTATQSGAGLVQAQGAVALAQESNTTIHDDFFGDGQTALLWQNGKGGAAVSEVKNDALVGTAASLAGPAGKGWSAVASGDFSDAAGHSDVLWQNSDGRLAVSLMSGATVTTQIALRNPGLQWTVVGTGDFDGDGNADILMQNKAGALDLLTLQGTAVRSRAVIDGPGAGWTAAGIGDFDGNGQSDILWRNGSGALAVWIMDGTSVASELQLAANPGADWSVVGTGDLTGDGKADILLQNATTGALDIWAMNGTGVTSKTAVTTNPGSDWRVAGVGAFSGSGRDGILYEDAATGGAMLAEVRHGQIASTVTVASPGAGWTATLA